MTPERELELCVLNLLRNRAKAGLWLERIRPVASYLSREGQIVFRSLNYAFQHGEAPIVTLKDLWKILQDQFSLKGESLEPIKDVLRLLKNNSKGDTKLDESLLDRFIRRAALMDLSTKAALAVESDSLDIDLTQALVNIAEPRTTAEEQAFWEFDPTVLVAELSADKIPTPWNIVNEEIEGGYKPGELIEVCALTKVGKTHFMLNDIAYTLKKGGCCGYVTIMDIDRLGIGLLLAKILLRKSKTFLLEHPEKLTQLKKALHKYNAVLEIADYTHRPVKVSEIDAVVGQWKQRHGDNLLKVVIDRLEEAVPNQITDQKRIASRFSSSFNVKVQEIFVILITCKTIEEIKDLSLPNTTLCSVNDFNFLFAVTVCPRL